MFLFVIRLLTFSISHYYCLNFILSFISVDNDHHSLATANYLLLYTWRRGVSFRSEDFGNRFRRCVYDLHHSILGLLFVVLITRAFTDAIRNAVGWPRPDFFWHCMRILPHDQNTGAFFIVVVQKVSPLSDSFSYD
ncbi:hypothetical protein JHK82_022550 [Glycine max]|uniref:Phosphatidic acid phosphatase type 2/haloperoxidase domain-containing protein n=1 Tax=Glycine max TaxID=3847 RepID=K7L8Z7_SOYBN|nr:uncharacterized protein LOC102668803 [Glycine max]KAG4399578.1 hypothetical protein GLYMA_08G262600v4 [Glycine max]KAG5016904.1 hypothetical protein JHK85_023040 [Glycine max]KAG5026653.1 hypothetical protein JHK86_022567 [Glycine max]KAG5137819.1 hypothetical protein JHK82_022550 [Glycine max]KAH1053164.1 hypothetical protein GYH30_022457 [Glycine max]|eukprot:XP_006585855.1 uncharacterized protein LOC102668803 [Glycine max]